MHVPTNVKAPNNISEWQMRFNSVFKGLNCGVTSSDVQSCADCYLLTDIQEELAALIFSVFHVFGKCDTLKSHIP
jgi:hypothetical protein